MKTSPAARPLAITMGDAAGIGPEIVAKLFAAEQAADCVVIGDVAVLRRAAASIAGPHGAEALAVARIDAPRDARDVPPRCIPVL
ncbi:MAG TPA: 4-hydroxythreonine-4-phosphate dehydrogenase PdxA, partial [Burkholderiaceae bacterium]|nr:4-hydroxythreonine-4-phosphate dehydrogenase PdxA [Burkholderiaceae bacterium]